MKRPVRQSRQHLSRPAAGQLQWRTNALFGTGDLLLGLSALGALGGAILLVRATVGGADAAQLMAGAALTGLGGLLLLLWERIAWEPFVRGLGRTLAELS